MWKLYAVKTLYRSKAFGKPDATDIHFKKDIDMIEERIVVIKARNFNEATKKGEKEAFEYCSGDHVNPYGQKVIQKYIGCLDAFEMYDELKPNSEIYSATQLISSNESNKSVSDRMFGKIFEKDRNLRTKFCNRLFSGVVKKGS